MAGSSAQVAPESDLQVSDAVRNHLFENVHTDTNGNSIPGDLIARNIQRGRDHGVPGYKVLREECDMEPLRGTARPTEIDSATWSKLMTTYKNDPTQIDGFTGGLAETAPADGKVGSLFACILGKQFERLRDGDRFFFTHGPSKKAQGLKPAAKNNILARTLGAILCDNLDAGRVTERIGRDVFRQKDRSNTMLECSSAPKMNLAAIVTEAVETLNPAEDPTKIQQKIQPSALATAPERVP